MLINDDLASPQLDLSQQRGNRLKLLRTELLRLSRNALAEIYNIPAGTIQNWEDARHGGLTEKGARRFIEVLNSQGINCKLEWLLYGIGQPPEQLATRHQKGIVQKITATAQTKELDNIAKELMLFYEHIANAVDMIVSDDAMLPRYLPGDHLAGKRYFNEDLNKLVGQVCIIQTQSGIMTVRQLLPGSKQDHYDLIASNKESKIEDLNLFDMRIFSAAPVLWIRRANPLSL
jgi:hypothetical protein